MRWQRNALTLNSAGFRKQSDLQTLLDSEEINDQMKVDMDALPHYEEMNAEEKLDAADIFNTAALRLFELCLPPGWDENWKRPSGP